MTDEPKKRKGNPNFKTGGTNPYKDKATRHRWKKDKPNELVEQSKELVENQPEPLPDSTEPPKAA